MIARIWHGVSEPDHADAYEQMLKPEPLPGLGQVPGYKGSCVLLGALTTEKLNLLTILLFDSLESIRAVTGEDYEAAVVPEERRLHLKRWDPKASHYEVASVHGLPDLLRSL